MPVSIHYIAETGSTNADLIARLAAGDAIAEGAWLVADRQLAGRGRQGREWLDAAGNFMGSTLVRLGEGDPPPPTLSFVAALAVYEAVSARIAMPERLRIKWPNDLELDRRKISGILLEREGAHAVIGIGVNLAATPIVPERTAGSLADLGEPPTRDAFAESLAASFAGELARWRSDGAKPLIARWLAAAHPLGTPLCVHDSFGAPLSGTFAGLEPDGALLLRLADGTARVIHAGDVEAGAG